MPATDRLHQLIHSLSPSEKRSFKIFANRHVQGKQNNYVELFDAIAQQINYDEDELRAKFSGRSFEVRLSYEKTNLYKLVLRSMRNYKEQDDPESRLKYMLTDAAFLRRKSLFTQETKVLEKAYLLASKFEKFHHQLEILDLQRQNIVVERIRIQEKLAQNQQLRDEVLNSMTNYYQYQTLADTLFVNVRENYQLGQAKSGENLAQALTLDFMQDEKRALSWRAKVMYCKVLAHIFQLKGESAKLYHIQNRLYELWNSEPHFKRNEPIAYVVVISNMLNATFNFREFNRMEGLLEELNLFPAKSLNEKIEVTQNFLFYSLLFYMNNNRLGKALSLVEDIEKALQEYHSKLNPARVIAFYYNVTLLFLITQKYQEALNWSHRIINQEKSNHRIDIKSKVRFLQLIFHYELQNFEFVLSLLRSLDRYLIEWKSKNLGEMAVLTTFRELVRKPATEHLALFHSLLEQLEPYPKSLCYAEYIRYLAYKTQKK